MTFLEALGSLSDQEIKTYVKERAGDESLVHEILKNKEKVVRKLISTNSLMPFIVKSFKGYSDLAFLVEEMIEAGFMPSEDFLHQLIELGKDGEPLVEKIFSAFPKFPVSVKTLVMMTNSEMIDASARAVLARPELQTVKILQTIIKMGCRNTELLEICAKIDEILDYFYDNYQEQREKIPSIIADEIVRKYLKKMTPTLLQGYQLSKKGLAIINDNCSEIIKQDAGPYGYYRRVDHLDTELEWTPDAEECGENLSRVVFLNAPENSKHRRNFISKYPDNATDSELLELSKYIGPCRQLVEVLRLISERGIPLMEQVEKSVYEKLTPSEIARTVRGQEKRIFLLKRLNSKLTAQIRKDLPPEILNQHVNKKSRFDEVYKALCQGKMDLVREITSGGYTLEKFVEDTNQSSKIRKAENLVLTEGTLKACTKEEILLLANSNCRFSSWAFDTLNKLNLNFEEYQVLRVKVGEEPLIQHMDDLVAAIKGDLFSENSMIVLVTEKKYAPLMEKMPQLASLVIKKFQEISGFNWRSINDDFINFLARYLTRTEILKIIPDPASEFQEEVLGLKDVNGEYVIADEELKKVIAQDLSIEKMGTLKQIAKRDLSLYQNIVKAYNKGIKQLNEFLGYSTGLTRRSELTMFKNLMQEVEGNGDKVLEEYLSGRLAYRDLTGRLFDLDNIVNNYTGPKKVKVAALKACDNFYEEELAFLISLKEKGYQFEIGKIKFGHGRYEDNSEEGVPLSKQIAFIKDLAIASVEINFYGGIHDSILTVLRQLNTEEMEVTGTDNQKVLYLAGKGVNFSNSQEIVTRALEEAENDTDYTDDPELLETLLNNGMMCSREVISNCLENRGSWRGINADVVEIISKRLGGLENYYITKEVLPKNEEDADRVLATGLKIVSESEYDRLELINNFKHYGVNFKTQDISEYSNTQKAEIIRFIENEIDPRFKDLNLTKMNLAEINEIEPYELMKAIYQPSENSSREVFLLPPQFLNNKKFIAGLEAYLHTNIKLPYKIKLLQSIFESLNIKGSINHSDLLDFTNHTDIQESEGLRKISLSTLSTMADPGKLSKEGILYGIDKQSFLRFLRSCGDQSDSYLDDTINMASAAINGIVAVEKRIESLKEEGADKEEIENLIKSKEGLLARFYEVKSMDNVVHCHDRLVTLLNFIKTDGLQPLGLDKFKRLEKDAKVSKEIGYKLFFPKIRGDLQEMGRAHGWCVSNDARYGNNVIEKGNILVGVVPQDKEATPENVVALAHFVMGNQGYYLEQFKWSCKVRGYQADATHEINHKKILEHIKTELVAIEERRKEKQNQQQEPTKVA